MTLADRLGFAKYLYNLGKEYREIFQGSVTGGAALTFVANYFGLSKVASIAVGAMLVPVGLVVAIVAGWAVLHWRIVHVTIEREWENNPFMRTQIDTLREIRDRLAPPPPPRAEVLGADRARKSRRGDRRARIVRRA